MMASLALCGVYFGFWYTAVQNFMLATPDIRDYIRHSFFSTYGADSQTINSTATVYDEASESNVLRSWKGVFLIIAVPLLTIVFYVYIGYKILNELGKSSLQMSQKTKDMQKKLFEVLAIQTVIPIVVSFLPCTICLLGPAFNVELGRTMNYSGVIAFALFPFFDPLAIIFCLPVLRNRLFSKFWWNNGSVNATNTSSAHSS